MPVHEEDCGRASEKLLSSQPRVRTVSGFMARPPRQIQPQQNLHAAVGAGLTEGEQRLHAGARSKKLDHHDSH